MLRKFISASLVAALMAGSASADTLREALVSSYQTNPTLTAQRETLKGTDATVAIARAAGRPQVSATVGVNRVLTQGGVLVTGGLDRLWQATVDAGADAIAAANVVSNALVGAGVRPEDVSAAELAKLVQARDRIPRASFDQAISKLGEPDFSADPYLAEEAVSDAGELEPLVDAVLAANPGQVDAYRGGKDGLLGFFVGQVMKETQGKANPRVVSELVRDKLG